MPGFNISNFKQVIDSNGGLMRNNKFLVTFPLPQILVNSNNITTARYFEFYCEQASLPGVGISTHDNRRYGTGHIDKRPFVNNFQDLNLIFLADGAGVNHQLFYRWIQGIISFDLSNGVYSRNVNAQNAHPFEVAYKDDYTTDLNIITYNDSGKAIQQFVCREAFPTSIAELPVNWADSNSFARYAVQFAFTDWYLEGASNLINGNT